MSMLAAPDTITGPLTAADLEDARHYSTGSIYRLHRVTVCPPCHGNCNQGRNCNADACAPEGGEHHEPAPTQDKRRPWLGIALIALPWVLGVIGWAVQARMG